MLLIQQFPCSVLLSFFSDSCLEDNHSYQEHKGLLPYQNIFTVDSFST